MVQIVIAPEVIHKLTVIVLYVLSIALYVNKMINAFSANKDSIYIIVLNVKIANLIVLIVLILMIALIVQVGFGLIKIIKILVMIVHHRLQIANNVKINRLVINVNKKLF